jgi:hypothetical protein
MGPMNQIFLKRTTLRNCVLVLGVSIFAGIPSVLSYAGDEQKSAFSSVNNTKSSNDPVGVNMDDNIRLRRDLDEYSRSVDPAHVQIEERRRVMRKRLQERFLACDRDEDGYMSLDEAYECMPQVARRFGEVDTNGDRGVSLEELEVVLNKISEREKILSMKSENTDSPDGSSKRKSKESASSPVKKN